MPKGVLILPSYYEAIRELPDNERLSIYDSIMEYGFEGVIPELSGTTKAIWLLIKPNLDKSAERYERNCENGKRSNGRPKKKTNLNPKQTQSKPKENSTLTETEKGANQDCDSDYDLDYELDLERDFDSENKNNREFSRAIAMGIWEDLEE